MAVSSRTWSVVLEGVPQLRDILRRAGVNSGALAAAALYQEGLKIMNVSQRQVPVRYGVLRSTGHVYPPVRRGTAIEVVLAYGGPAAPYAWLQHEKMGLRHDSPTKAKYLEDPVYDYASRFEAALHNRMGYLFSTSQVLGSQWSTEEWHGPVARGRPLRSRRSPRRAT